MFRSDIIPYIVNTVQFSSRAAPIEPFYIYLLRLSSIKFHTCILMDYHYVSILIQRYSIHRKYNYH